MSIEELLNPRYKVIADWPGRSSSSLSEMTIGYIAVVSKEPRHPVTNNLLSDKLVWQSENGMKAVASGFFELYPHLFKKLEWWEDRAKEDLPMYLRDGDRIWKLKAWTESFLDAFTPVNEVDSEGDTEMSCNIAWFFRKNNMLPATEAEYNNYKAKKDGQ